MNKVAKMSLAGAGALFLFSVAYVGFASMNGVPMHTLPVFGSLFPAPPSSEHAQDAHGAAASADVPEADHGEVARETGQTDGGASETGESHARSSRATQADLLGAFQFDSPYEADELRDLVATLERKNAELDRRLAELATKEELVDDRLEAIEDRQKALDTMKAELEELQAELAARAEELQEGAEQKADVERRSVQALGALFEDGEVDALASRLVSYGPKEAAKILATLTPDRAKELLDALPQPKWREFAEAYTKTVAAQKAK